MCGDFKGHDPESLTEILVHQSVLRCERILVMVAETSIVDVRPLSRFMFLSQCNTDARFEIG